MASFIKVYEYRWWVGLWGDSDVAVWIEPPNVWTESFNYGRKVGDQLHFGEATTLRGDFSTLSGGFTANVVSGTYTRICTSIK
jgi:hypothetical protein